MIDQVGMEVADLAQTSALGFPKAEPDTPLVNLGMGGIDTKKPVILVIGHNVPPAVLSLRSLRKTRIPDAVEVTGICCTSLDVTGYLFGEDRGSHVMAAPVTIRSGMPDVVVVDEQCIRTDTLLESKATGSRSIATSDKNCLGLFRTGTGTRLITLSPILPAGGSGSVDP